MQDGTQMKKLDLRWGSDVTAVDGHAFRGIEKTRNTASLYTFVFFVLQAMSWQLNKRRL